MGFREKVGAQNSMALEEHGIQMEALPRLTHGKMLNSVLSRVGHTGTSKGREMAPTDSGGMGGSGIHGRGPYGPAAPARDTAERKISAENNSVKARDLMRHSLDHCPAGQPLPILRLRQDGPPYHRVALPVKEFGFNLQPLALEGQTFRPA